MFGVDGARGGWILAGCDGQGGWAYFVPGLDVVLEKTKDARVLIDMPIGLASVAQKQRRCDAEARAFLGKGLTSRVFTPPIREVIHCEDYAEANEASRRLIDKGISIQAWNIVPKIRDVENILLAQTQLQKLWIEAHPEVAFACLNDGVPVREPKISLQGQEKREGILRRYSIEFQAIWLALATGGIGGRFQRDDVLDALALAALNRHSMQLQYLPTVFERDPLGLPMRIAFGRV
ncbi:MAG: DUF429 domain-containing protein [Opitutales bacterium]|nr:DUF429 domain-containing protein [Opitutales bacterium]NRA25727.1 DUF429 domain-containing protein [Opitutales bacterium]